MTPLPRAFRGVGVILACWAGGRVLLLTWPEGVAREVTPGLPPVPRAVPEAGEFSIGETALAAPLDSHVQPERLTHARLDVLRPGSVQTRATHAFEKQETVVALAPPAVPAPGLQVTTSTTVLPSPMISEGAGQQLRWSASSWALVRGGSGVANGLAPNGQLGGSQAGARATLRLIELASGVHVGPTARLSSALSGAPQRELAAGISVRLEGGIPVELIAERRFGLSRGMKDRFALVAATGVDDVQLPAGLRVFGLCSSRDCRFEA